MKWHFSPFRRALAPVLLAAFMATLMAVLVPAVASATPTNIDQALESDSQTCATVVRAQERAVGIPKGLLAAIALAESGRWDGVSGEKFAWPWSVTTGGKGHFLPSREAAQTFVYELQARGVKNIDVGCMQINLKYHPDAFASIEEAFDPAANAAYGATFLKSQYEATKSWLLAAGAYHSTTPKLNQKYRAKISRLWQETARQTDRQAGPMTTPDGAASPQAPRSMTMVPDRNPDALLTMRLNDSFRDRSRQKIPKAITAPDPGQVLRQRLNTWRETEAREIGQRHASNYSRVTEQQARLGLLTGEASREARFAQARQSQLLAWRKSFVRR